MNKRMREIQNTIQRKSAEAVSYTEGETKDISKAQAMLDEITELEKELNVLAALEKRSKEEVPPAPVGTEKKADGFSLIAKMLHKKPLNEVEKTALVSGENAESGESYLVPEDVRAEINELRKTYVSAKGLVNVEITDALSGSVTYEDGVPTGLSDFDDGNAVAEEDGIKFVLKKFAIAFKGKLIPVSRILLSAAKASIMNYLNRWFVRNAILSENTKIFSVLKSGYKNGVPKALSGWKALKKSINKDIDPSCKIDGVIITNQSGWAYLDEEEDTTGRPILQPNPANATQKLFQNMVVHVFPDAQLPNIDGTHAPVIYGDTKAGCTFVEHQALEFAISEHYLFNKNQNCLRVIEGFDAFSTDTEAYIYGSLDISSKAAAAAA